MRDSNCGLNTADPLLPRHGHAFANSRVSMGAMIRLAGTVAGILATDKIKGPSVRWTVIAALGVATGIAEDLWRDHIERERGVRDKHHRATVGVDLVLTS